MKPLRLISVIAVGIVSGCASVPVPLEGDYSQAFYPDQATDRSVGANVRWGGAVVETRPESERTCIEILAQELDSSARPRKSDQGFGRFIACRNEFIDPEIFVNGREVTVTGELTGFREGKVGEFQYEYPVIDADAVYLWPETEPYGYGYGYPYGYGYGLYGFGYPYYRPYFRAPFFYGGFGSRLYYPYFRGGYIRNSGSAPNNNNANSTTKKP